MQDRKKNPEGRMRVALSIVAALLLLPLSMTGCAAEVGQGEAVGGLSQNLVDTGPERQLLAAFGHRVFEREGFDGNGRACATCHGRDSGTISPDQIEAAWQADPSDPLFRAVDSDDGSGGSYDRLRADATFRVSIPLPANVRLAGDPSATEVVLFRGATSTINNPGFESHLMNDGRFETLEEQAHGAVNAHFAPGRQPTEGELEAVAAFQQLRRRFYSSSALYRASRGQRPMPELPPGNTESEIRGRAFFGDGPAALCGHCHNGPALNETSADLLLPLPVGSRFVSVAVSEMNPGARPTIDLEIFDPDDLSAPPVAVSTPDPGRLLQTGDLADLNAFRIPTLWGVADTAPYFHDNSAPDLEALMEHYNAYFSLPPANRPITPEEQADIIAYMRLLR
jgi:cytochrome c peroxidase